MMRRVGVTFVLLGMSVSPVFGATAGMLSFQGLIKDSVGDPVTGPVDLTFALYDDEFGGNLVDMNGDGIADPLPGADIKVVSGVVVTGGILSTEFGPVSPKASDAGPIPGADSLWLEVTVNGVPLSRLKVSTAPAVAERLNVPGTSFQAVVVDKDTGKVGIGAAPDNASTATLQVKKDSGDAKVLVETSDPAGKAEIEFKPSLGVAAKITKDPVTGKLIVDAGEDLEFKTDPVGEVSFKKGAEEVMKIDAGGNIGVGTSTPTAKFHVKTTTPMSDIVVENASATGKAEILLRVGLPSAESQFSNETKITMDPVSGKTTLDAGDDLEMKTPPAGRHSFTKGATEAACIDANGNIGVGTSTPTAKFHVKSVGPAAEIKVETSDPSGKSEIILIPGSGTPAKMTKDPATGKFTLDAGEDIEFKTDAAGEVSFKKGAEEVMKIDASGNIGVGTSTPTAKFHVKSVGPAAEIKVETSDPSGKSEIILIPGSGTPAKMTKDPATGKFTLDAGEDIEFKVGAGRTHIFKEDTTEVAKFAGGKLGVGTDPTLSAEKFQVAGNSKMTGNVDVTGEVKGTDVKATNKVSIGPISPFGPVSSLVITADSISKTDGTPLTLDAQVSFAPTSDCCSAHGTTSCSDATCAANVCFEIPECCTLPWDANCALNAEFICPDICGPKDMDVTGTFKAGGAFTVDKPTGKVGIGTDTPADKLDVVDGGIRLSTTGGSSAGLKKEALSLDVTTEDTALSQATRIKVSGGADNSDIEFKRGASGVETTTMIIKSTGKVGIGNTIPTEALDVTGNIKATGTLRTGNSIVIDGATDTITATTGTIGFDNENLTTSGIIESTIGGFKFPDGTTQLTAGGGGAGDGHSLDAADGSPVDALFVDNAGNVGMGTTAPGAHLAVRARADDDGGTIRVERFSSQYVEIKNNNDTGGFLTGRSDTTNKKSLAIQNVFGGAGVPLGAASIAVEVGDEAAPTRAMTILESGNVGVGTTTPAQVLDVVGNVGVSGTVDGVDVSAHAATANAHHTPPTTLPPSGAAGGSLGGTYPNPSIAANSINQTHIATNGVASAEIVDGSITNADIATGAVTGATILDSSITGADINIQVITGAHILNGTITGTDIAADTITAADIATNGVGAAEIAAGAVGTSEIATNGVGSVEIIDNSITGADILNGTITDVDIADEPGIASATNSFTVGLTANSTLQTISSRAISVPASGYVLVIASGRFNTGTCLNEFGCTFDTDVGVSASATSLPGNQDLDLTEYIVANTSGSIPVTVHGLFSATAGSHTYYFLARPTSATSPDIADIQLSLVFIPTAYGTVQSTLLGPTGGVDNDSISSSNETETLPIEPQTLTGDDVRAELETLRSQTEQQIALLEEQLARMDGDRDGLDVGD